jgi:hypothetical protein
MKEMVYDLWTGLNWLSMRPMAGSCDLGSGLFDSIKFWELLTG